MRPSQILLALSLVLGMLTSCNTDRVTSKERSAWLVAAKIEPLGTAPAFERNSEVFLRIGNPTESALTIHSLNDEGAASLLHDGGAKAKIHKISVGVAKSIVVPPSSVKETSLLFEAAAGSPVKLYLYDKEFELPKGKVSARIRGPGSRAQ
jgi:hypothetical protein